MKKLTLEIFIEKARKVHGYKYDYSKSEYKGSDEKMKIICPIHGEFWQTPHSHLNGNGCKKCYDEKRGYFLKHTTKDFIEKSLKIHGNKYDYSKVNYYNDTTKVCIICPEHGEFWQIPRDHLNGHGCPQCGINKVSSLKIKPYTDFLKKAVEKHNNKYIYDENTYIDRNKKMRIICPIHGEFWQKPCNHLRGQGCPHCNDSILEKEVEKILTENNIKFISKCTSSVLKWLGRQHLDFYLPDNNIAIECQGIQHFEPREKFGGEKEYINIVKRDKNKKNKCLKNNIKILYYSSDYIKKKFNKNLISKYNLLKKIKNG